MLGIPFRAELQPLKRMQEDILSPPLATKLRREYYNHDLRYNISEGLRVT